MPTPTVSLLDEVLVLAKNSPELPEKELDRILKATKKMDEKDLLELKKLLITLNESYQRKLNREFKLWKWLEVKYREFCHEKQKKEEHSSRKQELQDADKLISNI